ncbi:hypothetical protein O7634_20620 [Micromonospora sp. WMMD1120]|uniref:hypothetical protein n=1 Tax=Micromonospora sp. WMMD1120 TaxID=3016106 RepID=UPI002415AD51|nr:hypothetical protein [Micromonospora sp. WMMD1120]MDG4809160.1 hypothetical protein [Micromonospora sp. WMMD1120]
MIRWRRAVGRVAIVFVAGVAVTACGADAVAPLPAQPGAPTPSASPSPSPTPPTPSVTPDTSRPPTRPPPAAGLPAPPAPTRTRGTPPRPTPAPSTPTSSCLGAVRYDLPVADTELELLRSLCVATGAVLRIQGIGPGLVTVDRPELVAQHYEAGVVDVRFLRPGTVDVMIPKDERTYTITVVVR